VSPDQDAAESVGALLLDFAAGTLPRPLSVLAATHAALNPVAAAELRRLTAVGGALLHDLDPAPIADDALETALAALDTTAGEEAAVPPTGGDVPAPLVPLIGYDIQRLPWRWAGWRMASVPLPLDDGDWRAQLLRVGAGARVPRHGHGGSEYTVCLEGGYRDGEERFARGDLQVVTGGREHAPVADADGPCTVLTVTNAPVRFSGRLLRFLTR